MGEASEDLLFKLGIHGYRQIDPKKQWQKRLQNSMDLIHKLPENLSSLQTLLEEELEEIIWLQPVDYRTPPFASAAYPEVPGKIFLTAGVFAYLPPALVTSPHNVYGAFENIIHECLHHRGEKIFKSSENLVPHMQSPKEVNVSWRKTSWTFSHAIQAYYVYLWILKLRQWRILDSTENTELREMLSRSLADVKSIIEELETQLSAIAKIPRLDLRKICTS